MISYRYLGSPQLLLSPLWVALASVQLCMSKGKTKKLSEVSGLFALGLLAFFLPLNSPVLTGLVGCLIYLYPIFFFFLFLSGPSTT